MKTFDAPHAPHHIAVVIPAHNEADSITACLTAIYHAIEQLPPSITVEVIVVLDSCTDKTENHIKTLPFAMSVTSLICQYRCVGRVRDLGVQHAIAHGAEWIACTDADSQVTPTWLVRQLEAICQQSAHMICGVVSVDNWQHLAAATRERYIAHYQDQMGHRHIHGANLSFSAAAYASVGGFQALPCHEDVELVNAFEANHYKIVWSNQVRVVTSSRLDARAEGGFGSFLGNLDSQALSSSLGLTQN